MFGRHGYHGVSLDKLAKAAGIQKAGLLHHFGSKEALYCALMTRLLDELAAHLRTMTQASGGYRERLRRIAGDMTRFFARNRELAKLLLREGMGDGPFFATQRERPVARIARMTEAFIARGIAEGDFVDQDPKAVFLAIGSYLLVLWGAPGISGDVMLCDPVDEAAIAREIDRLDGFLQRTLCAGDSE